MKKTPTRIFYKWCTLVLAIYGVFFIASSALADTPVVINTDGSSTTSGDVAITTYSNGVKKYLNSVAQQLPTGTGGIVHSWTFKYTSTSTQDISFVTNLVACSNKATTALGGGCSNEALLFPNSLTTSRQTITPGTYTFTVDETSTSSPFAYNLATSTYYFITVFASSTQGVVFNGSTNTDAIPFAQCTNYTFPSVICTPAKDIYLDVEGLGQVQASSYITNLSPQPNSVTPTTDVTFSFTYNNGAESYYSTGFELQDLTTKQDLQGIAHSISSSGLGTFSDHEILPDGHHLRWRAYLMQSSSTPDIYSPWINFQVATATPITYGVDGSSFGINTSQVNALCSAQFPSASIGDGIGYAMCSVAGILFIPTHDSFDNFLSLPTEAIRHFPFAYISSVKDALSNQTGSTTGFTGLEINLTALDPASSTMPAILPDIHFGKDQVMQFLPQNIYEALYALQGIALYLGLLWYIYRRVQSFLYSPRV